ncbi:MAG: SusC/RagA family TonB-linked outer membrane protein [Paludibacter sp.]
MITESLHFNRKSSCNFIVLVLLLWLMTIVKLSAATKNSSAPLKTVTGIVTTTQSKHELSGVFVIEKGSRTKAITDSAGRYSINVTNQSVLLFSFIGFESQTVKVEEQSIINIELKESANKLNTRLDEVVVTALGLKRQEKSLTYATQQLNGKELLTVPMINGLSALSGKIAGLTIFPSSSGVGSSTKVLLRNYSSIQGNNQPLFVVDGVPLVNFVSGQVESGNGFGGNYDAGDGISNLNPDDVESVNVLKGASAAALYGSQAANGVILITTKSGKTGEPIVSFTSSMQLDNANNLYKFQNSYGADGSTSWGTAKAFTDNHVTDFFRTGNSFINSISYSAGTDKSQNYVSYSYTLSNGIVPTNDINKHTLTFKNSTQLFNNRITINSKATFLNQQIDNPIAAPGQYFNPIYTLFTFPRGGDFNQYKTNFETFNVTRNMMTQNWIVNENALNNPYWILNRIPATAKRTRATANLDINVKITDWLNLKARGNADKTWDDFERKAYAGTQVTNASANGRYEISNKSYSQYYGDLLLSATKRTDFFSINSTVGTSITDKKLLGTRFDSNTRGLYYANLFTVTNMIDGGDIRQQFDDHSQLQSVFGTVSLGYRDVFYVDATGRNDWSSTLPSKNNSYFYPSVGGSLLISQLLAESSDLPKFMNFAKVRLSYTEVGNDIPPYVFNPTNYINETGTVIKNTTEPNPDIRPERTKSTEIGADLRFFDSRLNIDLTYYKSNTIDQYFVVSNASGTGYSYRQINGGNIQNQGVELTATVVPIQAKNLNWTSTINFATNKSKAVELPEQYKTDGYKLSSIGYSLYIKEGGEYGEMWAKQFQRIDGKLVVASSNGVYSPVVSNKEIKIGSVNSDFRLGWNNSVTYKSFSLGFLIDGAFGGNVVSMTQQVLNAAGVTQETASARDNGGVQVDAVTVDANGNVNGSYAGKIDAKTYYTAAPASECVYDATNIRLRELSLSYSLPQSVLKTIHFIKSARVSVVGRNLLFLYLNAPYDPETTVSTTGNYMFNTDNFGIPATRSYGLTLNLIF